MITWLRIVSNLVQFKQFKVDQILKSSCFMITWLRTLGIWILVHLQFFELDQNRNFGWTKIETAYKYVTWLNLNWTKKWLHRCWWRMLETKCVGDNFEMLVTVFAVFVTNILYLQHKRQAPIFERRHEWLDSDFIPRSSKKSKNRKSDFKFRICIKIMLFDFLLLLGIKSESNHYISS